MASEEREFQIHNIKEARDFYEPSLVLDVGYPVGAKEYLDLWGCEVETVDPFCFDATYTEPFESFTPEKQYDLVNLSSVLDYFTDPVAGLRSARRCGRAILLQGRLNTYRHPRFKTKYWTPTREWVEDRAAIELGLKEVEWTLFLDEQFFSICGEQ